MKVTRFSRLTNVSVATIRRWISIYEQFLSPTAVPPKGQTRTLTAHDQRVLYHAAQLRDTGLSQDAIIERLRAMQENDWQGLVELPIGWGSDDETVSVALAASRASEVAQISVLQNELTHIRQKLEAAQNKVTLLEERLRQTDGQLDTSEAEKNAIKLELERSRGEVAKLQGQLTGYALGRDRPVSVVLIIGVSLLVGAALVIIAMLVTALIL